MHHSDIVTLEAFLIALSRLDSSSNNLREQLKKIGQISSSNLSRLVQMIEDDSQLNDYFWAACKIITADESQRAKSGYRPVNRDLEMHSEEIKNAVEKVRVSKDPVSESKEIIKNDLYLKQKSMRLDGKEL